MDEKLNPPIGVMTSVLLKPCNKQYLTDKQIQFIERYNHVLIGFYGDESELSLEVESNICRIYNQVIGA